MSFVFSKIRKAVQLSNCIVLPSVGGTISADIMQQIFSLSLVSHRVHIVGSLRKSTEKDPNVRWITVRPHGNADGKGVPVMIRVRPDGTGVVVGGAGGKLNYMRLTNLRSPEEWRQASRERKERKEKMRSELTKEDREEQAKAKEELYKAELAAQAEFLQTVGQAQGWDDWRLPEEEKKNMTKQQAERLERARLRDVMKKADAIIHDIQEKVIEEHDAEVAQALGETSLGELDLSVEKDRSGLGYVAAIERVARDAGLEVTGEKVFAETARMRAFYDAEEAGYIENAEKMEENLQALLAGAAKSRAEDAPLKERGLHKVDAETELKDKAKAKDILLARQAYKAKMKEIESARGKIDKVGDDWQTVAEIARGVSLAVSEPEYSPEKIAEYEKKLEQDLAQTALRKSGEKLMAEIEQAQERGAGTPEYKIDTGRYNACNEIAQTIFKQSNPIDRLTADLLGTDAAANLLAHAMRQNMSPDELDAARDALAQSHVETQRAIADKAIEHSAELLKQADDAVSGINLAEATADDLILAKQANEERKRLLNEASDELGEALGRLEFAGTLNFALMGSEKDTLDCALGQISTRRAYQIAQALGLERISARELAEMKEKLKREKDLTARELADELHKLDQKQSEFEVVSDGPNKVLSIRKDALEKLLHPLDPEAAKEYEQAVAIKRGDDDEAGWLPKGFRDPKAVPEFAEAEEAFSFQRPLELSPEMSPEEIKQETFDFLDRALADNPYNPRAVRHEATCAEFVNDNVPREAQEAFAQAVAEYFPEKDLDDAGVQTMYKERVEAARAKMIADGTMSAEQQALHSQAVELGETTYDAIHSALAKVPEASVVFRPVKTAEDRRAVQAAVQDYFWSHLTKERREDAAADRAKAREEQKKAEATAGVQFDIFGEPVAVPASAESSTRETKAEPDAWQRFVASFGSGPKATERAYESVQDHMRGVFAETFAREYARRYGVELKTGTKRVPHWDRFVIGAADKATRQALLQEEESTRASAQARAATRVRGKFAPGARRELAEKILQRSREAHQLGFFSEGEQRPICDRITLGETAEAQLAKIVPEIAKNFKPGEKTELPTAMSMDGKFVKQQRAIKLIKANKRVGLHLGVGCVSGDTVLVDPVTGASATVRDYYERNEGPRVLALADDGTIHQAQADAPFIKGRTVLREVTTADGNKVTVAPSHLFLTPDGWKRLDELSVGDSLCAAGVPKEFHDNQSVFSQSHHKLPNETQLFCDEGLGTPSLAKEKHPLAHEDGDLLSELQLAPEKSIEDNVPSKIFANARHCWNAIPNSRCRYQNDSRSSGAQFHQAAENVQCDAPFPSGVREHNHRYSHKDALADAQGYSPIYQQSSLPSKKGYIARTLPRLTSLWGGQTCGTNTQSSQWSIQKEQLFAPDSSVFCDTDYRVSHVKNRALAVYLYLAKYLQHLMQHLLVSLYSQGARQCAHKISIHATILQLLSDQVSSSISGAFSEPMPNCKPYWTRIATIADAREETFFDFEVPVYHNYIAHGLVHHNSGKTVIGLGAFTDLHKEGKAKRAIYVVPSVVAGQFGGEARKFLEPRSPDGTRGYRWQVASGIPQAERLASYKNPEINMVFVTHQALRDDVLYEVSRAKFDGNQEQAAEWLRTTPEEQRRPEVQQIIKDAGWGFDFSMIDEGHDLLNRRGKPNSAMANAIDDFTSAHEYHVSATGTPVKNDVSEAFDLLHKLRPDKYPRSRSDEFQRRYSLNTKAAREALQREVAAHVYADRIDPGAKALVHDDVVPLSDTQRQAYRGVLQAYRNARRAKPGSDEQVEAIKALVPDRFAGLSDTQQRELAKELGGAKGMLRDMALQRVTHASKDVAESDNSKLQKVIEIAQKYAGKDADGGQVPGVIFAHNLESVRQIYTALKDAGYRVGRLTGENTTTEKELARLRFHPPGDYKGLSPEEKAKKQREAAQFDILVASDAAACGANLQRGGWLLHYDQPDTSKTHEQRTGRVHRIGQDRDAVNIHNVLADTPLDRRRKRRVEDKAVLGQTFQEPTELLDDTGLAHLLRQAREDRLNQSVARINYERSEEMLHEAAAG